MLTIAAAKMCGYRGDGHIRLAAAVEFMHTATLLHDDVVDESDMRRGKKSARILWGNQASVLVGDFLLGQAFRMMVEVGSLPALKILSEASAVIAEGEVMQLAASKDMATTEEEYLAVIFSKTAALFAAASEIGGLSPAEATPSSRRCASMARISASPSSLSTTRSTIRARPPCSARASATISAKAKSRCRLCCRTAAAPPRSAPSGGARFRTATFRKAIWHQAIALMRRHNAIEETIERARIYGREAQKALDIFPESEAKAALSTLSISASAALIEQRRSNAPRCHGRIGRGAVSSLLNLVLLSQRAASVQWPRNVALAKPE